MDFFILSKTIVYLFLSMNSPTTLVFEEPVEYLSAGKNGDFSIVPSNNKKIIVVQPLKNELDTNMVVITKNNHYHLKIKSTGTNPHDFIYIYPGRINKTFVTRIETKDFKILEGDTSVMVQNKQSGPILVNELSVIKGAYFSKGTPLFINEKRVLN